MAKEVRYFSTRGGEETLDFEEVRWNHLKGDFDGLMLSWRLLLTGSHCRSGKGWRALHPGPDTFSTPRLAAGLGELLVSRTIVGHSISVHTSDHHTPRRPEEDRRQLLFHVLSSPDESHSPTITFQLSPRAVPRTNIGVQRCRLAVPGQSL